MEKTANIIDRNKGINPSLLMAFAMFELSLIGVKEKLGVIFIKCINFKKETGLYIQN